jgi:diaminohydroxyphosphoribosylaminopyrimidine deaminase/5-amino-6-(5-phosphoribosylamino)uracil reductase
MKTSEDRMHEKFMRRAIALAQKGVGKTVPNPAVGCAIVSNGAIVGEGWHKKAGTPHAEINALQMAGKRARNADVYVTLEPCAHYGKTPPCADALIAAGVARVFVGMVDPNPKVCGKGIAKLRNAGISVTTGILPDACRKLVEPFIKHVTTGLPYVIFKSAVTLDGKTATIDGDSKWISSDKSRRLVHKLRAKVDAIMVGVGTILADNPLLTARTPKGRDPDRIIVDSRLRTPLDSRIIELHSEARTIIATCSDDISRIKEFTSRGVAVLRCRSRNGHVDLQDLMVRLGEQGVQSILIEGGSILAGAALRDGLIDRIMIFIAPRILAGEGKGLFAGVGAATIASAIKLEQMKVSKVGDDLLIEGKPEKPCSQV